MDNNIYLILSFLSLFSLSSRAEYRENRQYAFLWNSFKDSCHMYVKGGCYDTCSNFFGISYNRRWQQTRSCQYMATCSATLLRFTNLYRFNDCLVLFWCCRPFTYLRRKSYRYLYCIQFLFLCLFYIRTLLIS